MRHVGRTDHESGLLITEMTERELESLPEYSFTVPTSPRAGFMWRRQPIGWWGPHPWYLGHCYGNEGDKCLITWRRIIVIDQSSSDASSPSGSHDVATGA